PIPEENSSLSANVDDYLKMITGALDDETTNWSTPYKNEVRIEKEEVNETKGSLKVQSDDENVPSDAEEEEDSDDEYDHELYERLQHEEMARLAKLEEKNTN